MRAILIGGFLAGAMYAQQPALPAAPSEDPRLKRFQNLRLGESQRQETVRPLIPPQPPGKCSIPLRTYVPRGDYAMPIHKPEGGPWAIQVLPMPAPPCYEPPMNLPEQPRKD
jgi:hypothetical protein